MANNADTVIKQPSLKARLTSNWTGVPESKVLVVSRRNGVSNPCNKNIKKYNEKKKEGV